MLATAVIVFREILEAALIIGVVAAATRGVRGRGAWLFAGVGAGVVGAGIVALATGRISEMASGMGQELFNAAVLGIAVLMLAWHNVWMAAHGAALSKQARQVGIEVRDGGRARSALLILVALAVLREGSETVLFLYGIAASEGGASPAMLAGGLIGIGGGVVVGYALYRGLLRIPLRLFFGVTSALVLFLAAGLASQAARFLVQADILPSLATPAWDASSLLPQTSILGTLLHGLVGYEARPAGIQVVVYVSVLLAIAAGMWMSRSGSLSTATASGRRRPLAVRAETDVGGHGRI
jgi:high-affinity iron transporter